MKIWKTTQNNNKYPEATKNISDAVRSAKFRVMAYLDGYVIISCQSVDHIRTVLHAIRCMFLLFCFVNWVFTNNPTVFSSHQIRFDASILCAAGSFFFSKKIATLLASNANRIHYDINRSSKSIIKAKPKQLCWTSWENHVCSDIPRSTSDQRHFEPHSREIVRFLWTMETSVTACCPFESFAELFLPVASIASKMNFYHHRCDWNRNKENCVCRLQRFDRWYLVAPFSFHSHTIGAVIIGWRCNNEKDFMTRIYKVFEELSLWWFCAWTSLICSGKFVIMVMNDDEKSCAIIACKRIIDGSV